MINATAMCKAGGKRFNNWYRLDTTKELIDELEEQLSNPDLQNSQSGLTNNSETRLRVSVIDIKKGGNDLSLQGSWIHPDLAVQLAQWISPLFALKVSKWIRELAITGSVSLGTEKSNIELLELQKNYKKLHDEHRKILQKKVYYKFKKGPSFYIISDIDSKSVRFKPGFEGVDVSTRLQQHRSSVPGCKLEFLIYTEDAKLVETMVFKRFESKRNIKNKEWLFDIDVSDIIKNVRTILNIINIKYTEEENIKEYNEQIDLDFSGNNEELSQEELYEKELDEEDESCEEESLCDD